MRTRTILQRILCGLSLVVLTFVAAQPVVSADALKPEQRKLFSEGLGYVDYDDASCAGGGDTPPGTLPKIIPEPYNGMMTKGANQFKVAPALIAALFTEENFTHSDVSTLADRWQAFLKKHPDPNSGWPTNEFHTMGAFQFIPGTWAAYGADGDGDGVKDAQHFADGAAGAANYVAHNGATADKPPASWQNAIFAYNHAQWYVDAVMMYYNFYATGGTADTGSTTAPPAATQVSLTCANGVANVNCDQGASGGTVNVGNPTSSVDTWNKAVATKAVCLARAELAIWKAGQLKPGTDFFKYSYGVDDNWCGFFVSWIYKQAGYPMAGGNGAVGLVSAIKTLGQKGGKFTFYPTTSSYVPRPGDLVIHDLGGAGHVNMVSEVSGNTIKMIGGNQSTYDFHTSNVSEYSAKDYKASDISGFVSPTGASEQPI